MGGTNGVGLVVYTISCWGPQDEALLEVGRGNVECREKVSNLGGKSRVFKLIQKRSTGGPGLFQFRGWQRWGVRSVRQSTFSFSFLDLS